jgi:undecaprenyl-diphosphatase
MSFLHIVVLAAIQGAAELLPVSSSAHVIVAEKLMGLDPSSPELTFLLVMLHTGTMFAVLVYFWKRWAKLLSTGLSFIRAVIIATAVTGVVGLTLKVLIEKIVLEKILGHSKGEVETLFQYLPLIALNLFVVGAYIIYAGIRARKNVGERSQATDRDSVVVGLIQALCLPFRGLSRSGATISTTLIRGLSRSFSEDLSFALAVVLTPPVILLELHRLMKSSGVSLQEITPMLQPGLLGMVLSFISGLLALKWLSSWLENGKWTYFGYYCLLAGVAVLGISQFT